MGRKDKTISTEKAAEILLGEALRVARQSKGIPLTQMASLLSYSKGYLSGVENNIKPASKELTEKYEKVLGLSTGTLVEKYFPEKIDKPVLAQTSFMYPTEHLPFERNPLFTGREKILDRLHAALSNEKSAPLTQAISGLGGIGKTQTALEYAYRHQPDYSTILWLNADSRTRMLTDINALAELLNLPERHQPDQTLLLNAFQRWLQQNQGWLLILDNADDLSIAQEFLPRSTVGGHMLITTRSQIVGRMAQRVEIEEMGIEEGALFLLRRARILAPEDPFEQASEQNQERAKKIAKLMDGLPLALDQAGAYIDETQCGLDEYIELFQKRQSDLLKRRGRNVLDHPDPVATTWSLSFEKVQQANPTSVEILSLCAFLDPDIIYEEIFTLDASQLGPLLSTLDEDPLAFNDAITELLNYSLIRRTDHILTVHRLVQLMLKNGMNQDTQHTWAQRVVLVINYLFPSPDYENWPLCFALLPQAKNSAALIEQWGIELVEAARLLNDVGMFLEKQGEYKEAHGLLERALDMARKVLGEEHPDTALSVNNLALLYQRQGRYAEAEPLYEQGLQISRKVLGEEHPSTITSVNNLAGLYASQGRYAEAEPLYEQGLQIRRKVLGEEHPDTATSLNNLAFLYERQGRYAEAEPLYEQGLQISRKVLGEEHPDTATGLNNLAMLYASQGRYEEAEPLYEQALMISVKVLGEEHPTTLTIAGNYAYFLEMKEDGQRNSISDDRLLESDSLLVQDRDIEYDLRGKLKNGQ